MANSKVMIPVACAFVATVMLLIGCSNSSQAPSATVPVTGPDEFGVSPSPSVALSVSDPYGTGTAEATGSSISILLPAEIKAGRGVKGVKYLFDLDCKAIHPDALITWYDYGTPKVGPRARGYWWFTFRDDNDYVLTVVANWTDSRGKKWTKSSPAVKFHIGPQPTLTLTIPADNGPGAAYVFTVKPNNLVPESALYSWLINEQDVGFVPNPLQFQSKKGDFPVGEYKIDVIAEWRDENGEYQLVSDTGRFTVSEQAQRPSLREVCCWCCSTNLSKDAICLNCGRDNSIPMPRAQEMVRCPCPSSDRYCYPDD